MYSGVSVIICCHNSTSRLPQTLHHLARQAVPASMAWEVLVINNNSTDDTGECAREEWRKHAVDTPLRVIDEATPGLSAARQKGIEESRYDYLIFCDDDNWLEASYVRLAYELLAAHPQVAAIGGNNIGAYETPPPEWMNSFERSYAIGAQGDGPFQLLAPDGYVVGAGMAFKKAVYQQVRQRGFAFYLTDRIGDKVVGGGDIELCFIFKLAGFQIAYSSQLILQHYMPASRIEKAYLIKMWHQYNYSWLVFEAYQAVLQQGAQADIVTEKYWQVLGRKRLLRKLPYLPRCLYHRFKENVAYFLPHQAYTRYDLYLLRHTKTLIAVIRELQLRMRHE